MKFLAALLLSLFVSSSAFAAVWSVSAQWSVEKEADYAAWVEKNWTTDIFLRGVLEDLPTDCADASYTMRALFAFENGLPFRVSTSNGGTWGESTSEFDRLGSPQAKFRAFLLRLYDLTNTTTLARDTYPIAINPNSFRPGIVYVSPGEHSYQVVSIAAQGVPVLLSSTTPKMNRALARTFSFPFYRPESSQALDGFRAFRWPDELNRPLASLNRASLEQYSIPGNLLEFAEAARKRLAERDETLAERIDREFLNICHFSEERAFLVVKSYVKSLDLGGRCLSGYNYDEYSTPTRDRRLKEYFTTFRTLRQHPGWETLDSAHRRKLLLAFVSQSDEKYEEEHCKIPTGKPERRYIKLFEVWQAIEKNTLSSNPNVSIYARWGLEPAVETCRR